MAGVNEFGEAFAAHSAGRLDEAERGYRAVLAHTPGHADAWHLLGLISHQRGRPEEAVPAIQRALQLSGPQATYFTNLGVVLETLGRSAEAAEILTKAIALEPKSFGAAFALASSLARLGKLDGAEAHFRQAIALEPTSAPAYNSLGSILQSRGCRDEAEASYRRALALNPRHARAHYNLGTLLKDCGLLDAAVESFRVALSISPDLAEAHVNLGTILHDQGHIDQAIAHARQAIALNPQDAVAHNNLGAALRDSGQLDAAIDSYAAAIALKPSMAEARHNEGVALQKLGREEEALESYKRAQDLKSDFAEAEQNAALLMLMRGNFAEGWKLYESRWRKGQAWRDFPYPLWQGQDGGTVLVWGEQGVGDEILYASMIPDLIARGQNVVIETDKRLTGLFERSFPGAKAIARRSPPDPATQSAEISWHSPLANLGRWLRPDAASFPKRASYLRPDAERQAHYRALLKEGNPRAIVGITWASINPKIGRQKSINLGQWIPILTMPGVRFVDLQYGDTDTARAALASETGVSLTHIPDLDLTHDLEGAAALAAACDLVISVSSTTAHLAASTGCPTWVLVPATGGNLWVWMHGLDHTPWYPNATIFRQSQPGHWTDVLESVREALHAYIANVPQLQQIN